jgi:Leucine-rich repeat (LRR) protein
LNGIRFAEKEKITQLGKGLRHCKSLQELDLSRNYLKSFTGLEFCKNLQRLNCYFNSIDSSTEILKLQKNQHLRELDLRLNPVTKKEHSYRLFVIHHLPFLQKLGTSPALIHQLLQDEREIKIQERQEARELFAEAEEESNEEEEEVSESLRLSKERRDREKLLKKDQFSSSLTRGLTKPSSPFLSGSGSTS